MVRTRRVGAWGLRLLGVEAAETLLVDAPDSWPELVLDLAVGPVERQDQYVDDTGSAFPLTGGGWAALDRGEQRASITVPHELDPDALVHPYLAPVVTMASMWHGRFTVHGGAFVHAGRAWGVLGQRQAGKSSLLGWCSASGLPVLTDDVLAVGGTTAFAGPRCVDLRAAAAQHFGIGRSLGVVRDRERWRVDLPGVVPEVPLGGWVALAWGDSVGVERMATRNLMQLLLDQRGVNLGVEAEQLLDLAALPAVTFRRPPEWSALDASMEKLLTALD